MAVQSKYRAGSTAIFTISFFDENNDSPVPNEAFWSLCNYGSIVNGREDVEITQFYTDSDGVTKADIVLSGDDLVPGYLTLVVEYKYDSDAGTNLPDRNWITFTVTGPQCG